MYPWIVHVERQHIDEWQINTTGPNAVRATQGRYYNAMEVEIDSTLGNHREEEMETWYCTTEETALLLAQHFARKLPGRNINVYELRNVVRSVATEPVTAKYTSKGLIPE